MKEVSICKLALFVLLVFLAQTSNAQVTIGSEHTPNQGALLDLKEDHTAGTSNSNKGLLLPRVKLETITPKVSELAQSIGNTGVWDETIHTGLVVYNTINTINACTGGANVGVYTWNGTLWLPLFQKEIPMPSTDYSSDIYGGVNSANSYILQTSKKVEIPIQRAFNIWKAYTGSTPADGKVLNIADANDLRGALAANIVWQEASDGTISDVIAPNIPVSITGTDENAILTVTSGFKTGNALVNVTIGGKVLWQWHIWVVADDPTQTAHMFNTGKHVYWFMDRYLGATSNQAGNDAHGLYYQWGRPTPIQRGGTINVVAGNPAEKNNLTRAIQTPDFISFTDIESHDWYSPTASQWNARWGDRSQDAAARKSPFDPCPYGWRVDGTVDGTSPWHCLDQSEGSGSNGWDFNETGRDIGFYALSGYRSNGNGSLGDMSTAAYVWTASPAGALASFLKIKDTTIDPQAKYNRANGMSVRCVKEYLP